MLYTSYIANLKNIPDNEDTVFLFVTRWKPKFNIKQYKAKSFWRSNLGPSETLLTRWKSNESMKWSEYRNIFLQEAGSNKMFIDGLYEVISYLNEGKDVFLLCYEKEDFNCHRSILREIFELNNIKCKEY